jgi:hypothetical protein
MPLTVNEGLFFELMLKLSHDEVLLEIPETSSVETTLLLAAEER